MQQHLPSDVLTPVGGQPPDPLFHRLKAVCRKSFSSELLSHCPKPCHLVLLPLNQHFVHSRSGFGKLLRTIGNHPMPEPLPGHPLCTDLCCHRGGTPPHRIQ